jgi:hypothetical protein
MNKILFLAISLLQIIMLTSGSGKQDSSKSRPVSYCAENPAVYEPVQIPTSQDTLHYEQLRKRYPSILRGHNLYTIYLPLVRGMVDTSLLRSEHFNAFSFIPEAFRLQLVFSPLVIEGEVIRRFNEDTSVSEAGFMFPTVYEIRITHIFKSIYPLKAGDLITFRTNCYGYNRSSGTDGQVWYSTMGFMEYEAGQNYMIALDRYDYMDACFRISKKQAASKTWLLDTYCPYSFATYMTSHDMSYRYQKAELTHDHITQFLHGRGRLDGIPPARSIGYYQY